MVRSVFVTSNFARRGYVYAVPLDVMVAENCASVITATVFLSKIDAGRHNGCGGPSSWLPFPFKNNNYPSNCVGVGSIPIGATPTQVDGKILFSYGDVNQ